MEPERHQRNMMLAMAEYIREPRAKTREVRFLLQTFGVPDQASLPLAIADGLPIPTSSVVYDFRNDILQEAEGKSFDEGGLEFMNALISHVAQRIALVAASLSSYYGKAVFSNRALHTTTRLLFPEQIAELALGSLSRAVMKCSSEWEEEEEFCPSSLTAVVFSSATTAEVLREVWSRRIEPYCPVAFAAILDYLTAEVLSLCPDFITEQDLRNVFDNDQELRMSFSY